MIQFQISLHRPAPSARNCCIINLGQNPPASSISLRNKVVTTPSNTSNTTCYQITPLGNDCENLSSTIPNHRASDSYLNNNTPPTFWHPSISYAEQQLSVHAPSQPLLQQYHSVSRPSYTVNTFRPLQLKWVFITSRGMSKLVPQLSLPLLRRPPFCTDRDKLHCGLYCPQIPESLLT